MSDNDLAIKQKFLREKILEKGYDAEEFMKLLESKKGEEGLDLANWSKQELEESVKEFINKQISSNPLAQLEKEEKVDNDKKQIENNDYTENISSTTEKVQKVEHLNMEQPQPQPQPQKLDNNFAKTLVNETTPFTNSDCIEVKVVSHQKVDGGLFSKSYLTYAIEVEPFHFKIKKRYSDILWLRNVLCNIYSNYVIPPLCKKNYVDRFSDYLVRKRMVSIQKFFEGLLIHPVIRSSKLLYEFLSNVLECDPQKKKKEYSNITAPTRVKDIKTLEGEIDISITKEKEAYLKIIEDYSSMNEDMMEKMIKLYKSLLNLMKQASDKMDEISGLWKTIYDKSVKNKELEDTSETYNILCNVMKTCSEFEKNQATILNFNVRDYFKYMKNESHSIKELLNLVHTQKNLYKKTFDKLYSTKEHLFRQQDLSQWQLSPEDLSNKLNLIQNKELAFAKMLPNDTKKVNMFKEFYGCFLNSMINEYKRIQALNSRRHRENIIEFSKKEIECFNDFHTKLKDCISFTKDEYNIGQNKGGIISHDLNSFLSEE